MYEATRTATPDPIQAHTTGEPMRRAVLVVEDDPSLRSLLRHALRRHGYQMIEAVDAQSALRALARWRPVISMVLSDHELPECSGDGFAREVARQYPGLPVAMMSGALTASVVADAPGVQAWLLKPFGLAALFRTVDRLAG